MDSGMTIVVCLSGNNSAEQIKCLLQPLSQLVVYKLYNLNCMFLPPTFLLEIPTNYNFIGHHLIAD